MTEKITENNMVTMSGEIAAGFELSHEIYGEKFYKTTIAVRRKSDQTDMIPIIISERIENPALNWTGQKVKITGQFRSYNKHMETGSRLYLSVFVRNFIILEDAVPAKNRINEIVLEGYICKKPTYRLTPLEREITDILLAVNRPYGKSDYIPCICWGRNARYVSNLKTGTRIKISGRIQSRDYVKKINETDVENRVAIEISINKLMIPE